MSRHKTEKGIVNTAKAVISYDLDQWNGSNWQCGGIGLHQAIFKSRNGQWYILHTSQWPGSTDTIEFISENEAYERLADLGGGVAESIIKTHFSAEFLAEQEKKEI